jgi:hypothetical protein
MDLENNGIPRLPLNLTPSSKRKGSLAIERRALALLDAAIVLYWFRFALERNYYPKCGLKKGNIPELKPKKEPTCS